MSDVYVMINTYPRTPDATAIQDGLWATFVPKLQEMEGFISVCVGEGGEDGADGVSITLWKTQEDAQRYLDSTTSTELDDKATFRPGSDRRVYRVFKGLGEPWG
jgi:heme-degrading monooxygenase HmoA